MLVTVGAGFIGSNFIYYLLDEYQEDKITCVDNLTYAGNLETLKLALDHKRFKFAKGDIADREFIFDLFSKNDYDVVVNFAAETHVDRSVESPEIFLRTNILGTQVLMDT